MLCWGRQIRSYVLNPYTLVKDFRTEVETPNARKVLDGDLDDFLKAALTLHFDDRRSIAYGEYRSVMNCVKA